MPKAGSPAAPGQGEYVRHPDFPNLPASAPDIYVRTVHACLCHHPEDRPQFSQVEAVLSALGDSGKYTVRTPSCLRLSPCGSNWCSLAARCGDASECALVGRSRVP